MPVKAIARIVAEVNPEVKKKLRKICLKHEDVEGVEISMQKMITKLIEEEAVRLGIKD